MKRRTLPQASTMSSAYSRQSRSLLGDIHRLALDHAAEARLQGVGCDQVHLPAKTILEETLEAHEGQESGSGLEIHEDIEIAVLASVAADGRSEQGNPAHAEIPPDGRQIGAKRLHRLLTSHHRDY